MRAVTTGGWYLPPVAQNAYSRFTFAEYIRLERDSGTKHELLDGVAYAMAGGSADHAALAVAVSTALSVQLAGRPGRVFSSDLRVRSRATGLTTYADTTVVCGHVEPDPEDPHTVLNPIVLVEVLSPSTEEYDRGAKLGHYKTIPALREIALVAHDRAEIEIHRRTDDDTWSVHVARAGAVADLVSIGARLVVDAIFLDPLAVG